MEEEQKIVYLGEEIRTKIHEAIDKLASPVKVTLGPKGRNVIIRKEQDYYLTKDGVSVAKSVYSKDAVEQILIDLMKDVALETNKTAGDGTTTAIVIAEYLIKEGLKKVQAGHDPDVLKKEIEATLKAIIKELDVISIPVSSKADLKDIASISANGNSFIGRLVADAIYKSDPDSIVDIKESPSSRTFLEVKNGYTLRYTGYLDSRFIEQGNNIKLERVSILLVDHKLNSLTDIREILDREASLNNPVLLIAEGFTENVINMLLRNYTQGILKIVPILTPGIRDGKKDKLKDIAAYTNGEIFSRINNYPKLGLANNVTISKFTTTIINDNIDVAEVISNIKRDLKAEDVIVDQEKLDKRISDLLGKTSIIYVGGRSELEVQETIDRVEDAINATKAAAKEGIIPGGGITLYHIGTLLGKRYKGNLLLNAIKEPLLTIVNNALGKEGKEVIKNIIPDKGIGYNASKDIVEHMLRANIIDPVKVTKEAVSNAASIAAMLLTTEALILNEY